MDFGIKGIDPEPRRGYRTRAARDKHLEEFSNAVWQRHEATHARGGPMQEWPAPSTFRSNWPHLAEELTIADWKVAGAAARMGHREATRRRRWERWRGDSRFVEVVDEIPEELLYAPPPPSRDWHTDFAAELQRRPDLLADLEHGENHDGIELVLEHANLRPDERAVMRGFLAGDDIQRIAEDLKWTPQFVSTVLNNGRYRLQDWGAQRGRTTTSGAHEHVIDRGTSGNTSRTRAADVPAAPGSRGPAGREPGSGRGSTSRRVRSLPAPAAGV